MNSRGLISQIVHVLGRVALTATAAALLVVGTSGPASARQWGGRPSLNRPPCHWPRPNNTPEVDPGALRGALTLLVGGVLALGDRKRRG